MPVTAKLRHLRITPRKVRLVADLIRGKRAEEAQNILNFTIKKAAFPLLKLLRSALANAKNSFQLDESNLFISKILVDEGPKYKRWRARARGSANQIKKKTSHITIILDEIVKKPPKESRLSTGQAKKVKKLKPKSLKLKRVEEKVVKPEKPKIRPEIEVPKPKIGRGLQPTLRPPARGGPLKRIFRRKSF